MLQVSESLLSIALGGAGGKVERPLLCLAVLLQVQPPLSARAHLLPVALLGRCSHCKGALQLDGYASVHGVLYCKSDFDTLFRLVILEDDEDEEDEEEEGEDAPAQGDATATEQKEAYSAIHPSPW